MNSASIAAAFPKPSDEDQLRSKQLLSQIVADIEQHPRHSISFARFMEWALYAPQIGYYSSAQPKLGKTGDFMTAPEWSPYFGRCVAQTIISILQNLGNEPLLLEFGAGSGAMACSIIQELERQQRPWAQYQILELSPFLKFQQQEYLRKNLSTSLYEKIVWLESLPSTPWKGVMLANEVLDAMPVHRWGWPEDQEFPQEWRVLWDSTSQQLTMRLEDIHDPILLKVLQTLDQQLEYGLKGIECSEISLMIPAWLKTISQVLTQGALWLGDYGWDQSEYYHPHRNQGTLRCFYQHRMVNEPLYFPGLMDITASVDFSALTVHAQHTGLETWGLNHQLWYLISSGLEQMLPARETMDEVSWFEQQQSLKRLLMPQEMGEAVKIAVFGKGMPRPNDLKGFE